MWKEGAVVVEGAVVEEGAVVDLVCPTPQGYEVATLSWEVGEEAR